MPIESPQLDDLGFDELETLMRSRIASYTPEWTDHNDSDPGITMIQLFAHLGEQLGYRLNQLPEKNYIEFLKLIGIRLAPAEPASTTMAFVLTTPETRDQFLIPAGSKINAKSDAEEPPVFETDQDLDVTPAQLAALVTTRSEKLTRIQSVGEPGPTDANEDPQVFIDDRFSLAWDGKSPKLKDMPTSPVELFYRPSESDHQYVWLGLAFNKSETAGFLGSRVTLRVQLDSDEQPAPDAHSLCGADEPELIDFSAPDEDLVSYEYYRPPQSGESQGSWRPMNVIGDSTQGWTQSGDIRFDVPQKLGHIPDAEWQDVEDGLPHPLVGALKNPVRGAPERVPVSGWIRVRFKTIVPAVQLRMVAFNVVEATAAETALNEQLGVGNGQPAQQLQLLNGDVLSDSLELITVSNEPDRELLTWREVDSFDGLGPFERAYVLDPESGTIGFGDKITGTPPSDTQRVIARRYRYGGGLDTEVGVGEVNKPNSLPPAVETAVNIVAATGGKDAETLEQATRRAPNEMQSQRRAVTVRDFEFHAMQTTGLRVGRAEVVSFYRPFPEGRRVPGTMIPRAGLDYDTHIPGVVSVIVIPDEATLYPTPTKGQLGKVCRHLDRYRLITTEVYATVPQYVRIHDLDIKLRAESGFTRTQLREAISAELETYFHVLTGGEDGTGFPFGSTIHHADFVAQIFKVEGVARVETFSAMFDGQTPSEAAFPMIWRSERMTAMRLVNCPEGPEDRETIDLSADENVFVDASSVNVRFSGD